MYNKKAIYFASSHGGTPIGICGW